MQCRCRRRQERGLVPNVDSKSDHMSGEPGRIVGHRYLLPEGARRNSGHGGSRYFHLSAVLQEHQLMDIGRRNWCGSLIPSGQQGYEGRNRLWRQCGNFDSRSLYGAVGAPEGIIRYLSFIICCFCGRTLHEKDVQKIRTSDVPFFDGGVSSQASDTGLTGKFKMKR